MFFFLKPSYRPQQEWEIPSPRRRGEIRLPAPAKLWIYYYPGSAVAESWRLEPGEGDGVADADRARP